VPEAELFDARRFRPDLLYRLNTVVLRVPPLRERGAGDVALLLRHYLAHFAQGRPARDIDADALARLAACRWPGNVRELRQACERATLLARGPVFTFADFGLPDLAAPPAVEQGLDLAQREREAVQAALAQADGNISQAAKLLGVSRAALYRRLDKHGL
jgi:DNA-binding NtrC family response regulator